MAKNTSTAHTLVQFPSSQRKNTSTLNIWACVCWGLPLKGIHSILHSAKLWLFSGASAFIPSSLTVASCCSMDDERRWSLRYILLAVVPRVAINLMEATVSGEWMVETWHAAMETALLCTSVNHSITPDRGGDYIRKRGEARGKRLGLL